LAYFVLKHASIAGNRDDKGIGAIAVQTRLGVRGGQGLRWFARPERRVWQEATKHATGCCSMLVMPSAAEVRRLVADIFSQFSDDAFGPLELNESIRVDGGRIVARTYRSEYLLAMWMIDIGLLQFYDAEGAMLRTVNLFEELEPVRAAA
jgi:hypothetical protein